MDIQRVSQLTSKKGKFDFKPRTESLDWKRIASIDIDHLLLEGDTTHLLPLINSITFCNINSEFDKDAVDPAFIKLFRLSQLISEYLLTSQEKSLGKVSAMKEKCAKLEKERGKLSLENFQLKESLIACKKELKRRKEMLASTQNEIILGGNNCANGNEYYEQCPYCIKKFLTKSFLLSHIQRRHQGLPLNPCFPCVHHHTFGYGGREGLLEANQMGRSWKRALEETEMNVLQMQDELETRCKNLEEKVRQNEEVEESKPIDSVPQANGALEENVAASGQVEINFEGVSDKSIKEEGGKEGEKKNDDDSISGHDFENNAREEGEIVKSFPDSLHTNEFTFSTTPNETVTRREIEGLKSAIMASVQNEMVSLLSRLKSQEKFWQEKLASANENYEKQITELRQEIPNQDNNIKPTSQTTDVIRMEEPKGERGKDEDFPKVGFIMVDARPGDPMPLQETESTKEKGPVIINDFDDEVEADEERIDTPKPVAKPRKLGKEGTKVLQNSQSLEAGEVSPQKSKPDPYWESESESKPEKLPSEEKKEVFPDPEEHHDEKTSIAGDILVEDTVSDISAKIKNANKTRQRSFQDNFSDTTFSDTTPDDFDDDPNPEDDEAYKSTSTYTKKPLSESLKDKGFQGNTQKEPVRPEKGSIQPDNLSTQDESQVEDHFRIENLQKGALKSKSQLDLVRAKTTPTLEDETLEDVGLNPESTAIGLEEMGRALKHLKLKKETPSDKIQEYGQFEGTEAATKSFASFVVVDPSAVVEKRKEIEGDVIPHKSEEGVKDKSSFLKIFSAVKTSGKKFRKRVKSAVLSKPKPEAETPLGEQKKSLSASTPVLKKPSFFSKARWKKGGKSPKKEKKAKDVDQVVDMKPSAEISSGPKIFAGKVVNPVIDEGDDVEDEGEDKEKLSSIGGRGGGSEKWNEADDDDSFDSSFGDSDEEDHVHNLRHSHTTGNLKGYLSQVDKDKKWDDGESEARLKEIKQIIHESKKDVWSVAETNIGDDTTQTEVISHNEKAGSIFEKKSIYEDEDEDVQVISSRFTSKPERPISASSAATTNIHPPDIEEEDDDLDSWLEIDKEIYDKPSGKGLSASLGQRDTLFTEDRSVPKNPRQQSDAYDLLYDVSPDKQSKVNEEVMFSKNPNAFKAPSTQSAIKKNQSGNVVKGQQPKSKVRRSSSNSSDNSWDSVK